MDTVTKGIPQQTEKARATFIQERMLKNCMLFSLTPEAKAVTEQILLEITSNDEGQKGKS